MHFVFLLVLPLCWASCPTNILCEDSFNKCYKYVDRGQSYFTAEEDCVSMGGHLTSISNFFENSVIGETGDSMFTDSNDFWIGAYEDGKWAWTDKTAWSYTDWFPGEPSDNKAVSMLVKSHKWTTSDPDQSKPYVCELPFYSGDGTVTNQPAPSPTCPACPTPAHTYSCESTWTYFAETRSCYKVYFNQEFYAAEEICKQNGAHLTSIHSSDENQFVSNFASIGRGISGYDTTWIGLHQIEGNWIWTDESQNTFMAWGPIVQNGNCAQMFAGGYSWVPVGLENGNPTIAILHIEIMFAKNRHSECAQLEFNQNT